MPVYIGVDFHARQQTVSYLTSEDGEIKQQQLSHEQPAEVRRFYEQFGGQQVIVGFEASGYAAWFEELLEELGYEIWIGHATAIRSFARRRQKNDRRDAELILDLLVRGDFPRIHRHSAASREVLQQLRYRQKLVKMRTMIVNSLVFMGASLNPQTADPEFANNPRHEFNLWFDPEAAHIVLRAPWKKIVCTPVDISVKTRMSNELIDRIKAGNSPTAQYIGKYARLRGSYNYLWDELTSAAWLDPSLITKKENRYMDVNLDRGPGYGDTLTWTDRDKPKGDVRSVEVQFDLDTDRVYKLFVELLTAPTPRPGKPSIP